MYKILLVSIFVLGCAPDKVKFQSETPKTADPAQSGGGSYDFVRGLAGLEPSKLTGTQFVMQPGYVFEYYGSDFVTFDSSTTIDLATVGLNGLDAGSISDGDLFLYVIKNYTTDEVGFLASKETFQSNVTMPSGFSYFRKLPFAVVYNSVWGGIPAFHVSGWPSPEVRLTDAESSAAWCGLAAGADTTWTYVDLSAWIPDTARMVTIQVQVRYSTGTASSSYIRSLTSQSTGVLVGSVDSSTKWQTSTITIRVDSLRRLQYRNIGSSARLYIYVLGYSMTEPS